MVNRGSEPTIAQGTSSETTPEERETAAGPADEDIAPAAPAQEGVSDAQAPASSIAAGAHPQEDVQGATVEHGLYALILLAACALRVWNLGAQPLSVWEASNAWPAWLTAQALSVEDAPAPISALAYGFHWLIFWLGGDSVVGARLVGVLAGVALPASIWWWRTWLGRPVALALALLLALDPWLIGLSRLADGAGLALLCGMVLLMSLTRLVQIAQTAWEEEQEHAPAMEPDGVDEPVVGSGPLIVAHTAPAGAVRFAAVAAGLMLVAGPIGWNMLPVIGLFIWLWRRELAGFLAPVSSWLLWLLGAMAAGATFGFIRLDGVRWLASSFDVWLSQFSGAVAAPLVPQITGGYGWAWPWLRLLADTPLLPVVGAAGAVMLLWRAAPAAEASGGEAVSPDFALGPRRWLWFLMGWLVWGVVLLILPGRSPLALPIMGLPLLVLAATWLTRVVANAPAELEKRETLILLGTLFVLGVSSAFWLAALFSTRGIDPVLLQATGVLILLAALIVVAFAVWSGRRHAQWLIAVLVAGLFLLFNVRGGWLLAQSSFLEPAGFLAATAHPEVEQLAEDIRTLSAHRTGDPHQAPVVVRPVGYTDFAGNRLPARPDPIVGWVLRDQRNLIWADGDAPIRRALPESDGETADAAMQPLIVVQRPLGAEGAGNPAWGLPRSDAQYAGSTYAVEAWWLPRPGDPSTGSAPQDSGSAAVIRRFWRWSIYRQIDVLPATRDVALWAPLDS